MELIIVRHGETEWTISGQYTGTTDLPLTSNGHRQAVSLRPLLDGVLAGRHPAIYTSPRQRALDTARLAFPDAQPRVEPLLVEYDYGEYEGLTADQIDALQPGWNIWEDGCPGGESTEQVGSRADDFLHSYVDSSVEPVVVISHGHFSRVLAARALRRSAGTGCLFASATASVSVVKDYHEERCIGLWNASTDLIDDVIGKGPTDRETTLDAAGADAPDIRK